MILITDAMRYLRYPDAEFSGEPPSFFSTISSRLDILGRRLDQAEAADRDYKEENNSSILPSDAIRADFPILDFLEDGAYPAVVIISTADLAAFRENVPEAEQEENFKRHLISNGFDEAEADKIAKIVSEYMKGIQSDVSSVTLTSSDMSRPIVIMKEFSDKEDLVFRATGKRGWINLPGNIEDYNNFSLLHELAHAKSPRERHGERYADSDAAKEYLKLYLQGKQESPDVPYAFRALRILKAVETPLGTLDEHLVAFLSVLPGEKPHGINPETFSRAINDADMKIAMEVGKDRMTEDDAYIAAVDRLLEKMNSPKFIDKYGSLKAEVIEKVREAMGAHDIKSLKGFIALLPEELRRSFQESIPMSYALEGYRALSEQPELRYALAKKFLDQSRFDDPAQRYYIEKFLDAAQRYAADYYKVPEEDRKSQTPYADGEISLAGLSAELSAQPDHRMPAQQAPAPAFPQ